MATINGSENADTLTDTVGDDFITLRGGNDRITITGGTDTIDLGSGDDTVVFMNFTAFSITDGGGGNDTLDFSGMQRGVTLSAIVGVERYLGSNFVDRFTVASSVAGNFRLTGNGGDDALTGGGGSDSIDGGADADTLDGGAGNDTLVGGGGADKIVGGLGNDNIVAGVGDDQITGGAGNDSVFWAVGDGNDRVRESGAGSDSLLFTGSISASQVVLSTNRDDLIVTYAPTGETITLERQNIDYGSAMEQIRFLTSSASINLIAGYTFVGGTIQDKIAGGLFDDRLSGLDNDDVLTGMNGEDRLDGGAGRDTLEGGIGDDVLIGGTGDDQLNGGAGNDTADYSAETDAVTVNLVNRQASGVGIGRDDLRDIERAVGGFAGDTLIAGTVRKIGSAADILVPGNVMPSTRASAISLTGAFDLDGNVNIASGSSIPHATVVAIGRAGTPTDYYSFTVTAGTYASFDIDATTGGFDSILTLYDASGTALAVNDDTGSVRGLDPGSSSSLDSFLDYSFVTSGTYFIAVSRFGAGTSAYGYTLHTSLTGATLNPDQETGSQLIGGGGDDTLIGGRSDDLLDGGAGFDTASFATATAGVTASLATGVASGQGADRMVGVDALIGSGFADVLEGYNGYNVIAGGAGDDRLVWRNGPADMLDGGEGFDTVDLSGALAGVTFGFASGSAGSVVNAIGVERVIGSDFDDTLSGTFADETFDGDDGFDSVSYELETAAIIANLATGDATGQGTDRLLNIEDLRGGSGNDSFTGDDGENRLRGGVGDDTLTGAGGEDILEGGIGADRLDGGEGFDTADFDDQAAAVTVDLMLGTVTGMQSGEVDTLAGIEFVVGTNFDDLFLSGRGDDRVEGINGADTLSFASATAAVTIDMAARTATGDGDDSFGGIENMIGSDFDDTITGDSDGNRLSGGRGIDTIDGGDGADILDGGEGTDVLFGGAGDDVFYVDNSGDGVVERAGEGRDEVQTALATLILSAEVEALTYTGAATFIGYGNAIANTITGANGIDRLYGLDGDDRLIGGAGRDVLRGGTGDDTYVLGTDRDAVIEAADEGYDTVLSSVSARLGANIEALVLTGAAVSATGNVFDNLLTGTDLANVLDGKGGADRMIGGGGNDRYLVDNAADVLVEDADGGYDSVVAIVAHTLGDFVEQLTLTGAARSGTGNALDNRIIGSGGGDTLSGLDGADVLIGEAGNDVISGGAGADTITGGTGRDTMTGGFGADTFVFARSDTAAGAGQADIITDFNHGDHDIIALNAIDANTNTVANDAFAFIGTAAFSNVAGQVRYQVIGDDTLIQGDTNGDGTADLTIRLTGELTVLATDVVF